MQWRECKSFDRNSTEGPPSSVVILNSLLSILLLEWNRLSSCFSWHCVSRSSVWRVTAETGGFPGWRHAVTAGDVLSGLGREVTHDRQGRPCRPLCSGFPSAAELPAYRKLFILRAKKKNTIISPKLAQITVLWQFSMRRTSRKRNLKRNKNLKKQHLTYVVYF